MTPLPPDSTPRFRIHYTTVSHQHSFQVRSHASPSNVGIVWDAFLSALSPILYATTWDTTEFAADNSSVYNLVTTGMEGNTYGSGSGSAADVPLAYTFLGRSTGGRRWRLAMFGATNTFTNFRATAGESTELDAAIAVIVFNRADIVCIDDLNPVFKDYVDIKFYDHWVKEIR